MSSLSGGVGSGSSSALQIQLVPPAVRLRESFLRALREFQQEGLSWWIKGDIELAGQDFAAFVARKLADSSRRTESLVPATHLWAVADERFVGRLSIRHELNEALRIEGGHVGYETVPSFRGRGVATEMLRQALPMARAIGLHSVLLTCDDTNVASIRVIERNGGVLRETRVLDPGRPPKRYYWIRTFGNGVAMLRYAVDNVQFKNVGNTGDVVKHAALVRLAELAAEVGGGDVLWLDTHTFLLEAPCPRAERWTQEVAGEEARHPAAARYRELEAPGVAAGTYRCSSRLVLDVVPGARAILSERDPRTRERLREQLVEANVRPLALLERAGDLAAFAPPSPAPGAFLALVDPFVLDDTIWNELAPALGRLAASAREGIVEVFTYDEAKVSWPPAPAPLGGPVRTVRRGKYQLAVYATPGIAPRVAAALGELGWG